MQPGPLLPSSLPPGTQVGPWRIVDFRGSGGHGVAYLAEGVTAQASGKVVLKLALSPWEARYGREATLLSQLRHPCIPRFIEQGHWHAPDGLPYPYVVMEWIHGLPLYVWARAFVPSSRQVLQVLANVARALEATHAIGGLHRDVKGDNVLVRMHDGRGFLMDFGSSTWQGAESLTDGVFPPATANYRSPEAYRFAANILKSPIKQYSPGRADDLFALGVTGYRLVTGQYPPLPQDPKDAESRVWEDLDGPGPRPARELNPCCGPELSALISRMLSVRPEARGSARELAGALEHAVREAGPESDAPLYSGSTLQPPDAEAARAAGLGANAPLFLQQAPQPREGENRAAPKAGRLHRRGPSWLTAAGLVSALGVAALYALSMRGRDGATNAQKAAGMEKPDDGTVGVGDAVLTAPVATPRPPSTWSSIGLDLPDKPLPGQKRPDGSGRCADEGQVAINGGCWWPVRTTQKGCRGQTYSYRGECYAPAFPQPRPPTSGPTEAPDGGTR